MNLKSQEAKRDVVVSSEFTRLLGDGNSFVEFRRRGAPERKRGFSPSKMKDGSNENATFS